MWRYVEGAKAPKLSSSIEDKREAYNVYDQTKRSRQFQNKWLSKYDWLVFDNHSNVMRCRVCIQYCQQHGTSQAEQNTFVSGTNNFRLSTLQRHEQTSSHIQCFGAARAAEEKQGSSVAAKTILLLDVSTHKRVKHLFAIAHSLAKKGRPYSDFPWQCELAERLGVNIGSSYRSDKQCQTFVHYIAEGAKRQLVQKLKDAPFISIICDGSTDCSIQEQELIYVRYVHQGQPHTSLLTVESVAKADAETITNAIIGAVTSELSIQTSDWMPKLIGFGSDGAAVMMGRKSGVATRLAQHQPNLVSVHCAAHRLELTLKKLLSTSTYFGTVDRFLLNIYLFYHHSPLQKSMLKEACTATGTPFLTPKRVGGTRWVGHTERAITNLLRAYPAILEHLLQLSNDDSAARSDAKSKAKGFFKLMTTRMFALFLNFLLDVVTLYSKASAQIQAERTGLAYLHDIMEGLSANLIKYKSRDGPNLRSARTTTQIGDVKLQEDQTTLDTFEKTRQNILDSLIDSLASRFADTSSAIITAMGIVDFNTWPEDSTLLKDFGDEEVQHLSLHFKQTLEGAEVDLNQIETEWTSAKEYIKNRHNIPYGKSASWVGLGSDGSYTNLMTLVSLLLTLPAHSADCERGFSLLKRIKNDWRNKLCSTNLTDLMRVVLDTPDIKTYDPTEAVDLWMASADRRRQPNTSPYGKRVRDSDDTDSDVD